MTVNRSAYRVTVGDTDQGRKMRENVEDLKKLLQAYRSGELSERE